MLVSKQNKISVICPTLNNQKDISKFLLSIKKQRYPAKKVKVFVVDGGSKDKTVSIARKLGAVVLRNDDVFADIGVSIGLRASTSDINIILAVDNYFKNVNAFSRISQVFNQSNVIAAFPIQISSTRDSIFTKYINTFTDPVNHFINGYASNPRTFNKVYKVKSLSKNCIIFDYKSSEIAPMIAFAQGFVIRGGWERKKSNSFDDTTPVLDLIRQNKDIAYLQSVELYHHTIKDLRHFINKQIWKSLNYISGKNMGVFHRKQYLSRSQKTRIKIWPIYALTLLPPFIYAFYHLIKDRNKLWILHPFLCIISAYASLYAVFKFLINKNADYKRK